MDEFEGKLDKIAPSRLVSIRGNDRVEDFFLVLAVIFNDIKGLVFFSNVVAKKYKKPIDNEVSPHSGEFGGIQLQISKLMAGIVHEFFYFLEKNKEVLEMAEFDLMVKRLPREHRLAWEEIKKIVCGGQVEKSLLFKTLKQIRGNIGFHYFQSMKILRKGFVDFFSDESYRPYNGWAYYSVGDRMETTRFYYADGAVQQYLRAIVPGESDYYQKNLEGVLHNLNLAIVALQKEYLRSRPYK